MKESIALNYKKVLELEKIDSKEIAYIVGFLSADAAIFNSKIEMSVAIDDICILEFISNILNCKLSIDNTYIKEKRRFPRARINKKIKDIKKFIGGELKNERHLPIVKEEFVRYLVLGFFDGDGNISWGRRKDRNRIWQQISFTSSLSLLITLQKILIKIGISTSIHPKGNEKCFVLRFSNKNDVLKFCEWLYKDKSFIILKRKFNVYRALRRELGEFGETANNSTIPSRAIDHSMEGVETSGWEIGPH